MKKIYKKADDFVRNHYVLAVIATFILFHFILYMMFSSIISSTIKEHDEIKQGNNSMYMYTSIIDQEKELVLDYLGEIENVYYDNTISTSDKLDKIQPRAEIINTLVHETKLIPNFKFFKEGNFDADKYADMFFKEMIVYSEIADAYVEQLRSVDLNNTSGKVDDIGFDIQLDMLKLIAKERSNQLRQSIY